MKTHQVKVDDYGKKNVFSSEQQEAESWGKKRGGVEYWEKNAQFR